MSGKKKIDTMLRHGTVLTMDDERHILIDGSIAIDKGKIEAVGLDRDIVGGFDISTVRDLDGAVVHPGLVDAQ